VLAGRSPPNAQSKISETTVVQNLLFAFFGHFPNYREISRSAGSERIKHIDRLISVLNVIYRAIESENFDRSHRTWITQDFIYDNFANRKFNQYYMWIRHENVRYTNLKSAKFRNVLAAICAVGRDIFYESNQNKFEFVWELRKLLNLNESAESYREQMAVLGQIEAEVRRIINKPYGAISFDDDNQPVIRTKRRLLFPRDNNISDDYISGRFQVYLRDSGENEPSAKFIREYLVIERRQFGLVFRWESWDDFSRQEVQFLGVGFSVGRALWFMGHCTEPFQRMRVLAVNSTDWRDHVVARTPFCSGEILSHRVPDGIPLCRAAVFKREREGSWTDEPFKNRIKLLSRLELSEEISEEEIAIIG
jgi:hypothetical protein